MNAIDVERELTEAERERAAILQRARDLGLEPIRQSDPKLDVQLQAAYVHAIETVIMERAVKRLTVHVERLADMFEHVIDRERATVRVDSQNHF